MNESHPQPLFLFGFSFLEFLSDFFGNFWMTDLFDYSTLPGELRLEALGLCEPDTDVRNPVGRPRRLPFRERLEIGVRWREMECELARRGRSTEHPNLRPLLRQIARARKPGSGEAWKIPHQSAKADALGRFHSVPILPPTETMPEIDRLVAKEFTKPGRKITPRMVRSIRADRRIAALVGLPVWEPREWQIEAERDFAARQAAKRLMTPQRYAKHEPVALTGHGLKVLLPPVTEFGAPVVPRGRMNYFRNGQWPPMGKPSGAERLFSRLFDQRRKGWPIGVYLPRPR
jgi:hypothetical protein